VRQIISPKSVQELQHVFKTASDDGLPVYAYREGINDGLCLDLSKLDELFEIDPANLVAIVGPGVRLGFLDKTLADQGLRFIPATTPFYQEKTVGQLFYEGCSNLSSLKYGPAKHFLMGSEIVLPTGELLNTGGKTVKNVTGYDFTRFFNSPYTDYGITAKFYLKLLPLSERRKGVAATFSEVKSMLTFIKALKDARVAAAYLLWIDAAVQDIFQNDAQGQLILMEFDGLAEDVLEQYQIAAALIKKHGGAIREAADGCGQTAVSWDILYRTSDKYILTDEFKMPFNCQQQFINAYEAIAKDNRIKSGLFGQLAEGKLNIAFASPPDDSFITEVSKLVTQAGGISAGKYARLTGKPVSGTLAKLEQQAKVAFDPKRILNR